MNDQNLPATQEHPQPFPQGGLRTIGHGINAGAVAIESERAIAEAQGKLTLAKRFPRSMTSAINDFLEACNSPSFAGAAFYSVPNRGSGPSIRFAEEAARNYGNFIYGHRELSRSEGKSEIEVYAWDMEKNNESRRQITVLHIQDTKNGPKRLTDQADIDNKIANVASKQMRGRILALMPKHMIAAGIEACKLTLAGGGEKPVSERILAMTKAFGRFGVTTTHLAAHLNHPVDDTTTDELADLMGIFNAIKEGAKASEYFKLNTDGDDASAGTAAAIKERAKAGAAAPAKPTEAATKPEAAAKPKPVAKNQEAENTVKNGKAAEPDRKETKAQSDESADKQSAGDSGPVANTPPEEDIF
jgi:hypothetical protein